MAVHQPWCDGAAFDILLLFSLVSPSDTDDDPLMDRHIPLQDLSGKHVDHPALLEHQITGDLPASGLDPFLQEFNAPLVAHGIFHPAALMAQ